jgi:drug/metabolite transporter (DMT)-like permease
LDSAPIMTLLWIPLTIAAAFTQNVRSALQKHLKDRLGTTGATFVRFGYGFPFAIAWLLALSAATGRAIPEPNARFAAFIVLGGLAQILATGLLVSLFDRRNFAVGTTYSKTETVQAAIFAIVFFGEAISPADITGILVSLAGVVAISAARSPAGLKSLATSLAERPALIGLASGGAFGVAAVSVRESSLSLGGDGFVMQALFTLACMTTFQTVVMALWMAWRCPHELRESLAAWKIAVWVGLAGAAASAGWFSAMTIQTAALVRALGQIELIFTIASSVLFFRERILRLEIIGIALVVAGILILLLL